MTRARARATSARPIPAASRRCAACRCASSPASCSPSSARRARASRRCCTSWARSSGPPAGSLAVAGNDVAGLGDRTLAGLRARAHRVRVPAVLPARRHARARERRDRAALRRRAARPSGASGRVRCSSASASATGSPITRRSCRAASASAWRSPARWSAGRRSCSPTSRPATSTAASGAEIVALLRELNAEGATIVVITHDRDIAAAMPRRVEVRDGRVVTDG